MITKSEARVLTEKTSIIYNGPQLDKHGNVVYYLATYNKMTFAFTTTEEFYKKLTHLKVSNTIY